MWDFACLSPKISLQTFFFPFLFSSYHCSVNHCIVCVVYGRCNSSLFDLCYIVFESSYRCNKPIFLLLFLTHIVCVISGMKCLMNRHSCSLVHLWSSSLVHFKNGHEYHTMGTAFIPLMGFLPYSLVSSSFLVLLGIIIIIITAYITIVK